MSIQDQLISAIQNTPFTSSKSRASMMKVLAEQGDENAIRPMLQAINIRPLLNGSHRNDGNTMLDAALKLCQRHQDKAQPHLLEILNAPAPKASNIFAHVFDFEFIAATARREAAAHILGVLYGGEKSLADNLFASAKKGK